MQVARLASHELNDALPLLAPEGWTFEPEELARLHALGGAVGAREGGRLVGFLSFVDTPPHRWIGNVAVAPALRGRGVGAQIVREAMRDASRCALYSVEKAAPLYARLGFAPAGRVLAMRAPDAQPADVGARPLEASDHARVLALDARATRMDRSALLRALLASYPGVALHERHELTGFAIAKTYREGTELGPMVGPAAPLLDGLLAIADGPFELAAHEANAALVAAAKERGFVEAFRTTPMFTGGAPAWDLRTYGGVAGLEKG